MKKLGIAIVLFFSASIGLLMFAPESWTYGARTTWAFDPTKTALFSSDYSGFKDAWFKYEAPDGSVISEGKIPKLAWDWLDRPIYNNDFPRMNGGKLYVFLAGGKNYIFDLPST